MADDDRDGSDDVFSMALEWDSIQSIRTTLRSGGTLLDGDSPDIKSSVANKSVLMPVLRWMASRPGQKLPEVDQGLKFGSFMSKTRLMLMHVKLEKMGGCFASTWGSSK